MRARVVPKANTRLRRETKNALIVQRARMETQPVPLISINASSVPLTNTAALECQAVFIVAAPASTVPVFLILI